jgi:GDPmannose 4,6-dehydratase
MVVNYRESYNLFACSGILFNHESEYRGGEFVTQKIIESVVRIKKGELDFLELGNLDAKRDWGYAKDYVLGMYLMLQQPIPDDYVLATNTTVSVRTFVEKSFAMINVEIYWEGEGINEKGICKESGRELVKINADYYRPAEVDLLVGDYSKAFEKMGWRPETNLDKLIDLMFRKASVRLK